MSTWPQLMPKCRSRELCELPSWAVQESSSKRSLSWCWYRTLCSRKRPNSSRWVELQISWNSSPENLPSHSPSWNRCEWWSSCEFYRVQRESYKILLRLHGERTRHPSGSKIPSMGKQQSLGCSCGHSHLFSNRFFKECRSNRPSAIRSCSWDGA